MPRVRRVPLIYGLDDAVLVETFTLVAFWCTRRLDTPDLTPPTVCFGVGNVSIIALRPSGGISFDALKCLGRFSGFFFSYCMQLRFVGIATCPSSCRRWRPCSLGPVLVPVRPSSHQDATSASAQRMWVTARSRSSLTGLAIPCPFQRNVEEWSSRHHMEGVVYQAGGIDRT